VRRPILGALALIVSALSAFAPTTSATGVRVFTVAGTGGDASLPGPGGVATDTALHSARAVQALPDGGFLVADISRIMRVAPDGRIIIVAGSTTRGYEGDGGPASGARFSVISDVALLPDGGMLIADVGNNRVRRISPDGIVSTVAGNGTETTSGDGGPADAAGLPSPDAVAPTPSGGFLIGTTDRLRRVGADGIITTVAGGGAPLTTDADGAPGIGANLIGNYGLLPWGDGALFTTIDRVRVLRPDGSLGTAAGGGRDSDPALDGRARSAQLAPWGLAALPHGGFAMTDLGTYTLRAVSANGRIATLAGRGATTLHGLATAWRMGDGDRATRSWLDEPTRIAVAADGSLLVAESSAIRLIASPTSERLAVAIRNLRLGSRSVMVDVATTHPAQIRASLLIGRGTVATTSSEPNRFDVPLRLPLTRARGLTTVALHAVDASGHIASTAARFIARRRMALRVARAVIANDMGRMLSSHDAPGVFAPELKGCHRFAPDRIDCTLGEWFDSMPGSWCRANVAVTLDHQGLPRLRDYGVRTHPTRCPPFRRSPRWHGPSWSAALVTPADGH
jgi:hypothetical protein